MMLFRNSLRAAGLFILLVTGIGLASTVSTQPYPRHDSPPEGISLAQLEFDSHSLNYAYAGNVNKPGLIFIHGTPGSWQAFAGYLRDSELQQDYFMISPDRLGWGDSAIAEHRKGDKSLLSFAYQASTISAIMATYPGKKWLLVGHSLGASIAPKIALMEPEQISGLLLLAGSLKPGLGKARWYNLAASLMVIRWMLPKNLRYSNDEIMALHRELKTMEVELKNSRLGSEVVVIQGMKDRLVSPKNAAYADREWAQSFDQLRVITLPESGHFLPWEHAPLVKRTIREFSLD